VLEARFLHVRAGAFDDETCAASWVGIACLQGSAARLCSAPVSGAVGGLFSVCHLASDMCTKPVFLTSAAFASCRSPTFATWHWRI
jgi:hypothetical protein